MRRLLVTAILILNFFDIISATSMTQPWTWRCDSITGRDECLRELNDTHPGEMNLEKCKLTCGTYGSLVPRPQNATLGNETSPFLPRNIAHILKKCNGTICDLLNEAVALMINNINMYHPDFSETKAYWVGPWTPQVENHRLVIDLSVEGNEEYLSTTTNEAYNLTVSTSDGRTNATIVANTFFGARHALETLSQLIDFDQQSNSLQVVSSATIKDAPEFHYRGFILDTSRNFITVEQLKKMLDGMSYNKLNTFHWHITDTHSFPLFLNTLPDMAIYGAYSAKEVYSPEEIRELVKYARVRGVRIVPEIDAPAHVGHGWEWGERKGLGKLVLCLAKKPWKSYCLEAPCGQMNLANENIYKVLGEVYKELVDIFSPIDLFHYGGDEINLHCWNTSSEMVDWMTTNNFGLDADAYFNQWGIFQEKARQLLTAANGGKEIGGVIWTSDLTEKERADKFIDKTKYIIQIWTKGSDPVIAELLHKGYKVILSNSDAFYFDCGAASWVGKGTNWCSPYKGWQDVYDNDLYAIAKNTTNSTAFNGQILGGEAALWTEQIDNNNLETKLWPRGAALAERLWTNPSTKYTMAEHRILQHRHRLQIRGLKPERLQPEWCRQNQGQCRNPNFPL